eukprot:CAMPEP_0197526118 /NCGR_PEP_ID=MMETSP1318-20131121/16407_1 /TAXON_ID=552666 /ORGANISM="Partenskyella glossopodia, Strain RCC365" /LENGTH=83 /DNA_ID=CAMNT_0043080127 /DNA_START=195 /DNA_END=446 /DNA_ORIENTATION=+
MEKKSESEIEVTTLTLLGGRQTNRILINDIKAETTHPMSNFTDTSSGRAYYVHTNWEEGKEVVKNILPMIEFEEDAGATPPEA